MDFSRFIQEDAPLTQGCEQLRNLLFSSKRDYAIIKPMSLSEIQNLYLEFLRNFPAPVQPVISIGLAVLIVYSIIKVIKKDWIFLIALVILLPGSKTILTSIWDGVVAFIKFLLNTK